METTRQNKISRLIQKELSEIFIFPSQQSEEIVKNINDNMKAIRYELGTRVRHQLRIIPELKFFVDDSLDYIENIDKLLKE